MQVLKSRAGQNVGIKEVNDDIWLVSFMGYDLAYFEEKKCKLEPLPNLFGHPDEFFIICQVFCFNYLCF
jgi:hypothetical protein